METFFPNIYKDRTVLVTGDTGFKGSWLVIWLLKLGAKVIGYGLPPVNPGDNYLICNLAKKFIHIDGDIRDYQNLLKVFQEHKPKIVFHLAAQSLVLDSYRDPLYTYSTNIMGTANLLESVRNSESVEAVINVTRDKCYENKEWIYGYRHEAKLLQLDISKSVNYLKWHPVLDFFQTIKYSVGEYKIDGLNENNVFNQRVEHIKRYTKLRIESDKKNVSM